MFFIGQWGMLSHRAPQADQRGSGQEHWLECCLSHDRRGVYFDMSAYKASRGVALVPRWSTLIIFSRYFQEKPAGRATFIKDKIPVGMY